MKLSEHNFLSAFEEAKPALLLAAAILLVSATGSMQLFGIAQPSSTADAAYAGFLISSVTAEDLHRAVRERESMLQRSVSLQFVTGTGTIVSRWETALADHPSWVKLSLDMRGTLRAVANPTEIRKSLSENPIDVVSAPTTCFILREWSDKQGVRRIETDCMAEHGYTYDHDALATLIGKTIETSANVANVPLTPVSGTIVGKNGSGTLRLLASGESNFKGSGAGRKDNVRKALNEHISNIIIPQGEVFSFNSALGEKVTLSTGWKMALTIFEGGELRPSPGGGICQASTTLFRAALRAGLPILKRKSHSLYVTYYEKHGVGLDATIFMGHQDMIFRNDTPGPIVIQSRTIGDDAIVNIFGIDDGRSVDISGPHFAKAGRKTFTSNGHRIRSNEIAWERTVSMQDGTEMQEMFLARYKTLPLSLSRKYAASTIRTRGNSNMTLRKIVADNR